MTKADALGRWLQLNPAEKKRHVVSTWRLAGAGDVLGWTLAVDGNAVVVGQVNAKSSGANFAPIPAEHPRLSLEEVASWTLSEAMRRIDEGQVTDRDLNALYRLSGGNSRITWTAYRELEELISPEYPAPGVFVASSRCTGVVPLDLLLTGQKTIIVEQDVLMSSDVVGEDGQLTTSPFRQDGGKELNFDEKMQVVASEIDRA